MSEHDGGYGKIDDAVFCMSIVSTVICGVCFLLGILVGVIIS